MRDQTGNGTGQLELSPLYTHDAQRQSHRFVVMVCTALYEGQILRFTSFRNSDPLVRKLKKIQEKIGEFYNQKDLPLIVTQKSGYVEVRRGLTEAQACAILEATAAENLQKEIRDGEATKEEHPVPVHQGHDEGTDSELRSHSGDSGAQEN